MALRQVVIWLLLALTAVSLLAVVLVRDYRRTRLRFTSFVAGDPQHGVKVFERKGCAQCHAVHGTGGQVGPDLGRLSQSPAGVEQIVTEMWNHAPQMWERMQAQKLEYPNFSNEEMAHLFAFLYITRYMEEPGDSARGQRLFRSKGCVECHAVKGAGSVGPDLSKVGADTPITWAQTMWNHAGAMEMRMSEMGLDWPSFEGTEMNDLLAYVREVSAGRRREPDLFPASPDRGRKVFERNGCSQCHSVTGLGGKDGPDLAAQRSAPVTVVQFAGAMWTHSPKMWQAMKSRGVPRPSFRDREMADLIAYLYRVRYFGPAGSPNAGKELFAARGCSRCHGADAEGSRLGPRLAQRPGTITSLTLATALWQHAPEMYGRNRELGLTWPRLEENDVGHLVAFLNAPPEELR